MTVAPTPAVQRQSFHEAFQASRRRDEAARFRQAADRLEALRNEGDHDLRGTLGDAVIRLHDMAREVEDGTREVNLDARKGQAGRPV